MDHGFYIHPRELVDYWRSVILLGKNSASYKFALAKTLIGYIHRQGDLITLDELASPFSRHICEHLKLEDKQANSDRATYGLTINSCRKFNRNEISESEMLDVVSKNGFKDVLDCFHVVSGDIIPKEFFIDERSVNKGIRLTENMFELGNSIQIGNLESEIESRWRLVETAWSLKMPGRCIISCDIENDSLFTFADTSHRRSITRCRNALIGYADGRCFYCDKEMTLDSEGKNRPEADHFFPHKLKYLDSGFGDELDQIWNLVLSCNDCNGASNKSDKLPNKDWLTCLFERNNSFADSAHPLSDTIKRQTGKSVKQRRDFFNEIYNRARLLPEWDFKCIA
ncbi:MAG: HNH endonuclease [Phycisphaerae bacterium]|nr:HNH endonuclease [Phycisphaerae bacterium]